MLMFTVGFVFGTAAGILIMGIAVVCAEDRGKRKGRKNEKGD